jgi:hypothetical protein
LAMGCWIVSVQSWLDYIARSWSRTCVVVAG